MMKHGGVIYPDPIKKDTGSLFMTLLLFLFFIKYVCLWVLSPIQNYLSLVKTQTAGPYSQIFLLSASGMGLKICLLFFFFF